jgi:hypothetical protein
MKEFIILYLSFGLLVYGIVMSEWLNNNKHNLDNFTNLEYFIGFLFMTLLWPIALPMYCYKYDE